MKIIALGGAGEVGQWAARTVLDDPRVSELVIADLNGAAAARLAAQLGKRVTWAAVDVRDGRALRTLLSNAAVLMNTAGPFFRFGLPTLHAAIDARCHYIDICDDWEPTLDMLALAPKAREAGIMAVVGMGASPGLSNMAAIKAANALDRVTNIYTVWSLDGAAVGVGASMTPSEHRTGPSAATVHGVHQMTGTIRMRTHGRDVAVPPLRPVMIDFPGMGPRRTWTVGHPEAVTLPLYFGEGLQECSNVMFAARSSIAALKAVTAAVDWGWISAQSGAGWLERLAALNPPALPQPWAATSGSADCGDLPPLFALATGEHAGQPASAAVAFTSGPQGGMGAVTGIPLALGVSSLLDRLTSHHSPRQPGVFSPEGLFQPNDLFTRLLPYCNPQPASVDDLALLTTTWQRESLRDTVQQVRSALSMSARKPLGVSSGA
jgi:Saccharopine dehydrogenase NADP binding domain